MTCTVKIEFEAENPKEAVSKLKEIEKKILDGVTEDEDFEILTPLGDSLEAED